MTKKNLEFIEKFLSSPIVKAACTDIKDKPEWNRLNFTERLVLVRNKVIEKNIDLSTL
jgi:hypothetical protein